MSEKGRCYIWVWLSYRQQQVWCWTIQQEARTNNRTLLIIYFAKFLIISYLLFNPLFFLQYFSFSLANLRVLISECWFQDHPTIATSSKFHEKTVTSVATFHLAVAYQCFWFSWQQGSTFVLVVTSFLLFPPINYYKVYHIGVVEYYNSQVKHEGLFKVRPHHAGVDMDTYRGIGLGTLCNNQDNKNH
jgi:hypothetical protein